MAMDDVYRLVEAVLIDGRMTLLDGSGRWIEAEVFDASVTGDHTTGVFNGYVRYRLKGEQYTTDATFHELWKNGWTSFAYRDVASPRKSRKARR